MNLIENAAWNIEQNIDCNASGKEVSIGKKDCTGQLILNLVLLSDTTLSVFYTYPETLREMKIKCSGLIKMAEEISRYPTDEMVIFRRY